MLYFLLVLGQIPGTHFQLTFNELIALVAALAVGLYSYYDHYAEHKPKTYDVIRLHSFSYPAQVQRAPTFQARVTAFYHQLLSRYWKLAR